MTVTTRDKRYLAFLVIFLGSIALIGFCTSNKERIEHLFYHQSPRVTLDTGDGQVLQLYPPIKGEPRTIRFTPVKPVLFIFKTRSMSS